MTEQSTTSGEEFVGARDAAIAKLFKPNELVWQIGHSYNSIELLWDVDVIRSGPQGRWMLQRYSYDTTSGVLHFRGERPLADDEFARLRGQGRRLNV
jgi:hypothetical protein